MGLKYGDDFCHIYTENRRLMVSPWNFLFPLCSNYISLCEDITANFLVWLSWFRENLGGNLRMGTQNIQNCAFSLISGCTVHFPLQTFSSQIYALIQFLKSIIILHPSYL